MNNLKAIANRIGSSNMAIDQLVKIRKYIPIEEKFKLIKEYEDLVEEHLSDYEGYESLVGYVMFNLKAVQYYTNLNIEFKYEEFDILQENGVIEKIMEYVGTDYSLLLQMVQMGIDDK